MAQPNTPIHVPQNISRAGGRAGHDSRWKRSVGKGPDGDENINNKGGFSSQHNVFRTIRLAEEHIITEAGRKA